MNKRALHHLWTRLRPIRYRYLLVAAGVFLIVGIVALRQNNLTALRLRDEVLKVDQQNGDVETALRRLRLFVYSHMNSDLGGGATNIAQPIQLKYRYERLVTAEKERTSAVNSKVYYDAQLDCERRLPAELYGSGRTPCIQEYVATHGLKEKTIPDSLYKFDFISPRWSLDLAGISLALSGLFLILFVARFGLERWVKHRLSEHV